MTYFCERTGLPNLDEEIGIDIEYLHEWQRELCNDISGVHFHKYNVSMQTFE